MTPLESFKSLSVLTLFTAVLAVAPVAPASAQAMMCMDRTALLKELSGKYHEQRRGLGIASGDRGAMEVYVSKNGTWTIVMTLTNGNACIVAAGHSWQVVPVVAQGPEA